MSIPLDRLYTFISNTCNQTDMLIYRFTPHGSKNINECLPINDKKNSNFVENLKNLSMICHDQEPLNFEEIYPSLNFPQPVNVPRHPFRGSISQFGYFNVYDKVLLCHSEQHSTELEKFLDHGCIGVYYWSHALIARDWFRYAEHEPQLSKPRNPEVKFLIYNRAWSGTREYRLKFVELLINNNLHLTSKTKFNQVDNDKHYTQHQFKNESLKINRYDFENYLPINTSQPTASADFELDDYINTQIEVVLETLFDDSRVHLTEKTLRPIACGQPFILVATPGSLSYLRSYGFKTFSNIIDESYDLEKDSLTRLEKIITTMKSINSLSTYQLKELYNIAQYNRERFFSKEFHQQIVDEFRLNLQAGIQEMKDHCKASFLRHYFNWWDPMLCNNSRIINFKSPQEVNDLLAWTDLQSGFQH